AAIYESVQKIPAVTFHKDTVVDYEVETGHINVRLSDETEITAALLVGVDGRKSKVRELSSIDCKVKDYGQSAITCIVAHSRSHNDTATEFHRPAGPLAFV